jgi:hypothetical protein
MPTAKDIPSVWLKKRYLRAKVSCFALALKMLYQMIDLLLSRAPTQEELDLVFGEKRVNKELLKEPIPHPFNATLPPPQE